MENNNSNTDSIHGRKTSLEHQKVSRKSSALETFDMSCKVCIIHAYISGQPEPGYNYMYNLI